MMDEKPSLSNAVDTTDCLEAIGTFKSMKNLFFMVSFIALVILQGVFWLNYLGYVDVSGASAEPVAAVSNVETDVENATKTAETPKDTNIGAVVGGKVAADVTIDKQAEKVVSDLAAGDKTTKAATETAPVEEAAKKAPAASGLAKYMPKFEHASVVIRICNFVLIISATMYCLILLMSIKISLIGRLGGISHISRAFFLSLFALVILLPWQGLFEGVALGAIYLPAELFSKFVLTDESTLVCKIMYFARFSGMWGISLLLLLAAQARSAKWSKTMLRRLGVLR
ncbi:MAG: hypothetical protein K9M75_06840 [Phycisphaerae bacterium]|nr:hypothetical protein [Phycisphaerae bacterium]